MWKIIFSSLRKSVIILILVVGVIWIFLFFKQYLGPAESARGTEAKYVLKSLNERCKKLYSKQKDTGICSPENLDLGRGVYSLPGPSTKDCNEQYYFWYTSKECKGSKAIFVATRCTALGKKPQGKKADTVILTVDYATGKEDWDYSGQYCNPVPF